MRKKFASMILATVAVATLSACGAGVANNAITVTPTQPAQQVEATWTPESAADGFAQFKAGLDGAGYSYEVVPLGADLVGAERGEKYKFDFGKVELYRFAEGSEALTSGEIVLEGFGAFPIEVNGQYGAIIDVTTHKNAMEDIFSALK